jgi:hypothetical protein
MNSSLITADRTTHLKITVVSLSAAILVMWVGLAARTIAVDSPSAKRQIERSMSKPIAPKLAPRNPGRSLVA